MTVVYAQENLPQSWTKAIFLAGPTPREEGIPSWRFLALDVLYRLGYDGVVFVPEPRSGSFKTLENNTYDKQVEWEDTCLHASDRILFWIPRDIKGGMPAFTTNDEWGYWKESGKVVLGCPTTAEKVRYQQYYADKYSVPSYTNMYLAISHIVSELEKGALRIGGERFVPLDVFNHPTFQDWKFNLDKAGNRLDSAKVLWQKGKHGKPFCFALWAKVWITKENRYKQNEFLIARTGVSACVAYYRDVTGIKVLMVSEFRTPVSNAGGMVVELPGGSSDSTEDATETIVKEMKEEAGISIDAARLRYHSTGQLAATMLAHRASLFSYELAEDEYRYIVDNEGKVHGENDEERCYSKMMDYADIAASSEIDFSIKGMVFTVFSDINQ